MVPRDHTPQMDGARRCDHHLRVVPCLDEVAGVIQWVHRELQAPAVQITWPVTTQIIWDPHEAPPCHCARQRVHHRTTASRATTNQSTQGAL